MNKLAMKELPVGSLKPYAGNARTHSPKQIAQIAASIKAFGFNNPVLIDKDGGIIAGHGRVEAAKKLGLATVPCVRLEHLSEAQKRAYILADNKLAEKAGWDPEILKIELQHLTSLDLDFDITITGFEMAEIDVLLSETVPETNPADAVPAVESGAVVTGVGDVWQIGRHRLICGDATHAATYARLLDGERAQLVFTDPPYNVKIDGHEPGATQLDRALRCAAALGERWLSMPSDEVRALAHKIVARVVLTPDHITVEIGAAGLGEALGINGATAAAPQSTIVLSVAAALRRAGKGKRLVIGNGNGVEINPDLVRLQQEAFAMKDLLLADTDESMNAITARLGKSKGHMTLLLRLSYLAPSIVDDILAGRAPTDLGPHRLRQLSKDLPLDWAGQRRFLSFDPAETA